MRMKNLLHPLLPVAAILLAGGCHLLRSNGEAAPAVVRDADQLLLVTTTGWDSITGQLQRFTRDGGGWRSEGDAIPIVVGRTGLAWGAGFDQPGDPAAGVSGPHKREGDGRSPAGAFRLRLAFGFAPADSLRGVRVPYLPLRATTECVDDTASVHYNSVIDRSELSVVDWKSSERMRSIGLYRLGVIVDYNAAPPVKARGSCIFLHIWGGPRSPTSGCTAMEAPELERVVRWLDPRAKPVLVQLPAEAYRQLRESWALP